MADLIIQVIPEAYWGGKGPKLTRAKAGSATPGMTEATRPARKISSRARFWILVSGAFLMVVAGAAWYFTRPLRAPAPAPLAVVEVPPTAEVSPAPAPAEPTETVPEAPASNPPAKTEPTEATPPTLGEDIDRDGLSSLEETLYHSNPTQPDTDKDGFLDGHEVVNLYNPSGLAPQRLEDAKLAQRFVNPEGGYSLLIPIGWSAKTTVGSTTVVITDQAGQAAFEVELNDNPTGASLEQWYAGTAAGGEAQGTPWLSNRSGWRGLVGEGGLAGYFAKAGTVLTVEKYTREISPDPYQTTFEMMLNSFKIQE